MAHKEQNANPTKKAKMTKPFDGGHPSCNAMANIVDAIHSQVRHARSVFSFLRRTEAKRKDVAREEPNANPNATLR